MHRVEGHEDDKCGVCEWGTLSAMALESGVWPWRVGCGPGEWGVALESGVWHWT